MQYSLQFLPLIIFYACYQLGDLFIAAFGMALSSSAIYLYQWLKTKKHHKLDLITLIFIWIFATSSFLLQNDSIFKWKPTAVFWLFSLTLTINQLLKKDNLVEWMLADKISVTKEIWSNLDWIFAGFFFIMGSINIFVLFNFDTATWVNYKLFGSLILTFIFLIVIGTYLSKHSDDVSTE